MMIPAAVELGVEISVLAESAGSSARLAATVLGDHNDFGVVSAFAKEVDVITFDHEHVPVDLLRRLEDQGVEVRPSPDALICAQDKATMRDRLATLGVPVPRWSLANDQSDVDAFLLSEGGHAVAKTPRGGYDGKGVRVIAEASEISDWLAAGPVLLEEKVGFVREVAQLVARRPSGEIAAWPVVETVQRNGVCSEVRAPAPNDSLINDHTIAIASLIAEGLGVTGVIAVEMFVLDNGTVLVNELAMRPHNSGHIFTELSMTSQFEQHIRAVLDWPLGDTSFHSDHGVMVNIFGGVQHDKIPQVLESDSRIKLHDYGKSARPGRKAGHVNIVGSELDDLLRVARAAANSLAQDGVA
jgi:5-(carboxyamino)imidazole ribonucleotide synthase